MNYPQPDKEYPSGWVFCQKNTTCYAGGTKKLYLCVGKENLQ